MSFLAPHNLLSRSVRRKLLLLRRSIRAQLAAEAVAWAVVIAIGAGAITFACDWGLFRLTGQAVSTAQRAVVGVVVLSGAFVLLWRRGLRRTFIPLTDDDLAMIVERWRPQLGDRLIGAVQFARQAWADDPTISAELVSRMASEANEMAEGLSFTAALNRRPLAKRVAVALVVAMLPAVLALTTPSTLRIWFVRNVLLVDMSWRPNLQPPLDTYLALVGDGASAVVRGRDLPVEVFARRGSRVVPDQITLHIRTDGGRVVSEAVDRIDGDRYVTVLRRMTEPVELWATAGRARSPMRRVRIIEPTEVRQVRFVVEYPGYQNRPTRRFDGSRGAVSAPPGSWITVQAVATKALAGADVLIDGEPVGRTEVREVRFDDDGPVRPGLWSRFRLTPQSGDAKTATLQFALTDTEGFSGRAETSFPIHVLYDQPPELKVGWLALTGSVTTRAVVPLAIDVRDDCGLKALRAEVTVKGVTADPIAMPIRQWPRLPRRDSIAEHRADMESLGLAVGDVARLVVAVVDSLPVGAGGPNVRRSDGRQFRVVSDAELEEQLLTQLKQMRLRMEQAISAQAAGRDRMQAAADQAAPGGSLAEARRLAGASAARQQTTATLAAGITSTYRMIVTIRENNRLDSPAKRQEIRRCMQREIIDPLEHLVTKPMPAALAAIDAAVADTADLSQRLGRIAVTQGEFYDQLETIKAAMVQLEGVGELKRMLAGVISVSEEVKKGIGQRLKTQTGGLFDGGQ